MHIVITGAGRGIGKALFAAYQAAGHDVTGTTRDGPGRIDVTSKDDLSAFAARLNGRPIDLLVCNAGVYLDKFEQLDDGFPPEMWTESFAVNVMGVFLTVQALLPNLRAAKGKVAILSSQMASHARAPGGSFAYRASKAAVLNLGRNLATDLEADGVAVGIYHPGWVQTDMGGATAEISVNEAVAGLTDRFDALTLADTGCFLTWDGRDHPY